MRNHPFTWWFQLKSSLWFLPAVLTAGAILLAFATVELDRRLLLGRQADTGWFFGGGPEAARGVLSTVAGTMINVTALVFSITVVALQLASSQLTPRVIGTFMGDRGNQIVLGFFIATFTYALIVLRSVRAPQDNQGAFIPSISVNVAILLALVSVALLIYYVHHAANSMRVSVVVDRSTRATIELGQALYPVPNRDLHDREPSWLAESEESPGVVRADRAGYLQAIDRKALVKVAVERALTIRVEPCVGDFLLPGMVIASVVPPSPPDAARSIRDALQLGADRTMEADVEFGLLRVSDIAVKALSPGINDPNTAVTCMDRLAEVLVHLANRIPPGATRVFGNGSATVILRGPTFERLVGIAFDRIRHYGAGDPRTVEHLVATLGRMVPIVPPPYRPVLACQARLALDEARQSVSVEEDVAMIERAAAWVLPTDDTTAGAAAVLARRA